MATAESPPAQTRTAGHLWSIDRAAAALSITPRFLRTLVEEGSIRSVRLGRRVLIPDGEMARVMSEGVRRCHQPDAICSTAT